MPEESPRDRSDARAHAWLGLLILAGWSHSDETASLGMLVCHHCIPHDSRLRAVARTLGNGHLHFPRPTALRRCAISYLLKVLAELRHHKSDVSCTGIGRKPVSLARR